MAQRWRRKCEEQFSARGAVQRNARTDVEPDLQRPVGFDTIEIDQFSAIQSGDVAGLMDFRHQRAEHGLARGELRRITHHVKAECGEPGADLIALAVDGASYEAETLQQRGEAVRCCLRQFELRHEFIERRRFIGLGDELKHPQGALRNRRRGGCHGEN